MPTKDNSEADDLLAEMKKWMEEAERKQRPDYRNTVYCDKHLGVKMLLADSWSSIEYGETSVDVNPTLLWYCPKLGCDRHYEPTMFGYHVNKPGRRLQTDGPKQPRGNHPGVPFMYIGKFGEGRRFKCPYYKCGEQGPIVTEAVVDEHVEPLPPDPLMSLKKADQKRAEELLIFQLFAPACGLPIDKGSPENREPDYPDILCTISGQRYWFELGQIIHEEVAEKVNPKRRKLDGGFSYDQRKPFLKLLDSKKAKRYATDGFPVDLILYFDLRFGTSASVRRLCEPLTDLLKSLTTTGPFTRVWVFNVADRSVSLLAGPS
jgi:hypothetical protein